MNKKSAGISLVALVITIIVLIILTATVVVTFMDGGIIDRAREAVFKNDIAIYQEQLALKKSQEQIKVSTENAEKITLNADTYEEIKDVISSFKEEHEGVVEISDWELVVGSRMLKPEEEMTKEEEIYSKCLKDLGIQVDPNRIENKYGLQIGDIVNYEMFLQQGENSEEYYVYRSTVEETPKNQKVWNALVARKRGLQWKVLGEENGSILLVSSGQVSEKAMNYDLSLWGKSSYIYAQNAMQGLANLYSHGKGAVSARLLNMKDIDKLQEYSPSETIWGEGNLYAYENSVTVTLKYDEAQGKNYVEYTDVDGTVKQTYINYDDNDYEYFDKSSNSFKTLAIGESVTVINSYYGHNPLNPEIAELLSLDTSESLWLDTRVAMVNAGQLYYGFDEIIYQNSNWRTSRITLAYAFPANDTGSESGAALGFRVVVKLDPNAKFEKADDSTYNIVLD